MENPLHCAPFRNFWPFNSIKRNRIKGLQPLVFVKIAEIALGAAFPTEHEENLEFCHKLKPNTLISRYLRLMGTEGRRK